MKIGDRVRVIKPDFSKHNVGDEGVITDFFWQCGEVECFGVMLDNHNNPYHDEDGPDEGWAYTSLEIEVIK